MDDYTGTISPPGMYVKALYDYDADDRTSLSFRQGDIIQVLTQLESGWWDGIVHGARGWFPSNYCAHIHGIKADQLDQDTAQADSEDDDDEDLEEERYFDVVAVQGQQDASDPVGRGRDHEEAAFWIPQATADGRVFYFNTLTGVVTTELPHELSLQTAQTQLGKEHVKSSGAAARRPAELLAGGFERDESADIDQSASDDEDKRRSYISDGVSPTASMNSFNASFAQTRLEQASSSFLSRHAELVDPVSGKTVLDSGLISRDGIPQQNRDAVVLTWGRLIEDVRRAIERYRHVINIGQRAEYVKRAEDISDHIRLLLAAGSGTTDNHTGGRSSLASNQTLYPHLREMMARFSKLVLSTHVAAVDWSMSDTQIKCLQEADAVLEAVLWFIEIARKQRGEEIPRLFPGFVEQSVTELAQPCSPVVIDNDTKHNMDVHDEPKVSLNAAIFQNLHELYQPLSAHLSVLEEQLVLKDKLIGNLLHKQVSDRVCNTCLEVLSLYQPWIAMAKSINTSTLVGAGVGPNVTQYTRHKDAILALVAELVIACQAVAAPLADEWAARRDVPLEQRINYARSVAHELRNTIRHLMHCMHLVLQALNGPSESSKHTTDNGSQIQISSSSSLDIARSQENDSPSRLYTNVDSIKAKKSFGAMPASSIGGVSADGTPAYLRLDFEDEVQYDLKTNPPSVKGGTIIALVEQLTRHDRLNAPFNNTFLLTYQSFTTAAQLFEMLVQRWSLQPPPGLTEAEHQSWTEKKQGPIRFRIVNVLKTWFDLYWMEGTDPVTTALVQRVRRFVEETVATSGTPGTKQLLTVVDQRLRGETPYARRLVPNNIDLPPPIVPKNLKKFKFLDIDPVEFARQLTIIESSFYNKVKPQECLNKTWQRKVEGPGIGPAANVKALILHSNQLTNWVAQMILTQQDLKKRVNVMKHFIAIADKCFAISNFSTLTSIISALATAPIDRLARTWTSINSKITAVLERLRQLMGNTKNFAQYREALQQANPPCIPFFGGSSCDWSSADVMLTCLQGVYLTDLVFIEDGNPSTIKQTSLINFAKRAKTAEVIRQIQTYQNVPYGFKAVPELQTFITDSLKAAPDVHSMYEKSLAIEPREREDEKIAR